MSVFTLSFPGVCFLTCVVHFRRNEVPMLADKASVSFLSASVSFSAEVLVWAHEPWPAIVELRSATGVCHLLVLLVSLALR